MLLGDGNACSEDELGKQPCCGAAVVRLAVAQIEGDRRSCAATEGLQRGPSGVTVRERTAYRLAAEIREAEIDGGARPGTTTEDKARIAAPECLLGYQPCHWVARVAAPQQLRS